MKKWLSKNKFYLLFAAVGGIAGYAFRQQPNCTSGTCLLPEHPLFSATFGISMGLLIFKIIKKESYKSFK